MSLEDKYQKQKAGGAFDAKQAGNRDYPNILKKRYSTPEGTAPPRPIPDIPTKRYSDTDVSFVSVAPAEVYFQNKKLVSTDTLNQPAPIYIAPPLPNVVWETWGDYNWDADEHSWGTVWTAT